MAVPVNRKPVKKRYRRPDGSTYEQMFGPKSERDVEVEEAPPKGTMTPAPKPTPGPTRRQTSGGEALVQKYEKMGQEAADEAAARAEATEKFAPWKGKKAEQQEGGLGGAAAREIQKRSKIPADDAGDAVAEDAEKKKKKKNPNGGY